MKKLLQLILILGTPFLASSQAYNYYYGNLHSHSDYSDGNQDKATSGLSLPWQDFNYAKASYHMDFLGISEHNHNAVGMLLAYYAQGQTQADTTTTSTFVSLYGMEWGVTTNSFDGHVLIYGVNDLIGWETISGSPNYNVFCAKSDYPSLWPIINSYGSSFASICHPSLGEFQNLDGVAYNSTADNALVACVVRSGSAFSTTTTYTDAPPSYINYEAYYRKLLSKGYKIGPTIDHDNHNTTFGRTAETRTVILAPSLSKANIIDAYRNMRFYASDDWNAQVSFTVNASPMGSIINTYGASSINVTVTDPDAGDNVSSIQLYYGVPGSGTISTVLTSTASSSVLNYSHTTNVGDTYYYYARITQADGDIIWTSPIWITRLNSALAITGLDLRAYATDDAAKIEWTTQTEFNISRYEVERSYRGNDFHTIGTVPSRLGTTTDPSSYMYFDYSATPGTQFYRLKQIDNNGRINYSNVVAVSMKNSKFKILAAGPNPVKDVLNLRMSSSEDGQVNIKVYSMLGRLVLSSGQSLSVGNNDLRIGTSSLTAGMYIVVVEKDNLRVLETKFVKE